MDRLRMINCFVASAQLGSFSRASRDLGVTPASVSRQVSLLEGHLGLSLFNRTTRHLSLTEAGALFLERVSGALQQLSTAEDLVRELKGEPRGVLRVTAPASFGRLHIAPWLAGFLERYPGITLDLFFTDRVLDFLEERIDVAIRITAIQDSSTIGRKLARQHSVVCATPDYLARSGRPTAFADLCRHNCLIYGKHPHTVWRLYRNEDEIGRVEVGGNVRARDADSIYIAALAGVGVSLQPLWRVGDDLKSGRLLNLFPGSVVSSIGPATTIHAFYNHRRHLAPKITAFVDYLLERFGSPPYWE
jgi:DNA-binding transcriptional LysR family regulator